MIVKKTLERVYKNYYYIIRGLIIKESLSDETILDCLNVLQVELWRTDNIPKYWTAITFESEYEDFPERLSKVLKDSKAMPWYVDMKNGKTKIIVLKDHVLSYTIGNSLEKEKVINKCRELGINEAQLDWAD